MSPKQTADDRLLAVFRLCADRETVRWAERGELDATRRAIPFGQVAGARPVLGRGRLVRFNGRQLLTSDIAVALGAAGPGYPARFWFNAGYSAPDGWPGPEDEAATTLIAATWHLDGRGALRWLVSPHSTIAAGSPARGTHLAGRGDAALSYKGALYVSGDVEHVLRHGHLPWAPAPLAWD